MKKFAGIIFITAAASIPLLWVAAFITPNLKGEMQVGGKVTFPDASDCLKAITSDPLVLMIWLILTSLVGVLIFLSFQSDYKTETYRVTDTIKIPMPSGEGQYGTSWWMSDKDFKKNYPSNVVDLRNPTFSWLLKNGYSDLPHELQKNKMKNHLHTVIYSTEFMLKAAAKKKTAQVNDKPFAVGGLVVAYKKKGHKEYWSTITEDVHSLIIGFTGAGKTRHLVLQTLINLALAGESIFTNDIKGEIYQYSYPLLKRLGYKVIVLDFKNMAKSMSINFLQPVIDELNKGNVNGAIQKSNDIANILVGEKSDHGEPIWHNGELAVIGASIIACCYDNMKKPQNQNLPYVYEWITNMCAQIPNQPMLLTEYLKTVGSSHPANTLLAQANVAPDKTKGSFYTSAATKLALWTDRELYHIASRSDFDLREMGERKTAFFIILPDNRQTFYEIAALMAFQIYQRLSDYADIEVGTGRLPIRVNFLLDEFGNFPAIPNIDTMLTMARSKGMRFNLFLQSFAQLKKRYSEEDAKIIKDNCSQWIYLTASDTDDTLQSISKKLDTYTTTSYTKSSGKNQNSSTSVNYIQRDLLKPGELALLRRPYMLLTGDNGHKVTTAPDLSKWSCNAMLGLGNKKHNEAVRKYREDNRPIYHDVSKKPDFEGLWEEKNFYMFKKSYAFAKWMNTKKENENYET